LFHLLHLLRHADVALQRRLAVEAVVGQMDDAGGEIAGRRAPCWFATARVCGPPFGP
jgi:hypothetical protein